ncbi:MAG: tyrosine decarboxylase MfnA [Thermoplasmata archaeon]
MDENRVKRHLLYHYFMDYHYEDGNIIGYMTTHPLPISIWAHNLFIDSNMGNPKLFPGTSKMEKYVVRWLSKLHSGKNVEGKLLSGGTESNITSIWIAKMMGKRNLIVGESAHFSFLKAASLMNMNVRIIPLKNDFTIDYSKIDAGEDDIIVGVAGSTEFGTIDNISKLNDISRKSGAFLHVDAAFGGYVIPFLKKMNYNLPDYDFRFDYVKTISIDPHKMGLATTPSSVLLTRKGLYRKIEIPSPYLTKTRSSTLLGTRNSASIASAYANIKYLGIEGYMDIVKYCMENTRFLRDISLDNRFELLLEPVMNIVNIKIRNVRKTVKKLYPKWIVSPIERYDSIRIVLMPHVNRISLEKFIKDLKDLQSKI